MSKTNAQLFADYLADGKIEPCLIDKDTPLIIDGVQYYAWSQKGEYLPQFRLLAIQDIIEDTQAYNMTAADLQAVFEQVKNYAVEASLCFQTEPREAMDNTSKIQRLCDSALNRLKMNKAVDKVIDIAAACLLVEGENPVQVNEDVRQKKVAHMMSKPEYIPFFLSMGNRLLNPLQESSRSSFQNAIQELRQTAQSELEMMDSLSLSNYSESEGKKSEQIGYWYIQREILKSWIDFSASQPLSSTSS